MKNNSSARFDYIDALRGIAIIGVIVAHAGSITKTEGILRTLSNTGGLGVELFFVISAFTIFHMLSKHIVQEKRPIRNFFIRRLFRIVPVYWFGIIFYTLIFGLNSRGWLPGPELWHYPFHLTLTNLLHPDTQSSVVPGGWSISCEFLFYLSVPFLFFFIRTLSRAYLFTLLCVFILPLCTVILRILSKPLWVSINPSLARFYWDRFPLVQIGSFSFGILLFYLLRNKIAVSFVRSKLINACSVIAVGLLIFCLAISSIRYPPAIDVYCFLFMLLAILLAVNSWGVFVNFFTIFVGRISYSAYIFHFFVIKMLIDYLPLRNFQIFNNNYVYFIIIALLGVGFTIPMAYLGYVLIESPSIKASRILIQYLENKTIENGYKKSQ